MQIKKAKIRGVESRGMICAEDELGLGDNHDGIMVLGDNLEVGCSFGADLCVSTNLDLLCFCAVLIQLQKMIDLAANVCMTEQLDRPVL